MERVFDKFIYERVIKRINIYQRYTFLAAMVAGLWAHGFTIFNKISYLDDCYYYFDVGATFSSGRWGLGIIRAIKDALSLGHYSMPVWNGLSSLLILALGAMLVVRVFEIENKIYAILVGAYMVVFPVVTSTFAYMFTAPYYFLAALCMIVAVVLTKKYRMGCLAGGVLIAFGMGIYQAYFGVATALFVMLLLKDFVSLPFEENMKRAMKYFFTLVGGIVVYFLMNKLCLALTNTDLNDYQGISGLTNFSVGEILTGIKDAYLIFPELVFGNFVGISNGGLIRGAYLACFLLFIILAVLIFGQIKGNVLNKILYVVLVAMVPLSLAVISVMAFSEETYIHTLMIYDFVFIAIYPMVLLQTLQKITLKAKGLKLTEWLHGITCIVVALMVVFYIRLDNFAYLKANYQQENALAYFTVLMSEIKGTEEYRDELPVVFLGNIDGMDTSIAPIREFDAMTLQGYHTDMNTFISYYANVLFMEVHCGYEYVEPSNLEEIKASETVQNMPCYPDKGAVRVVDDVVVVKFSNSY